MYHSRQSLHARVTEDVPVIAYHAFWPDLLPGRSRQQLQVPKDFQPFVEIKLDVLLNRTAQESASPSAASAMRYGSTNGPARGEKEEINMGVDLRDNGEIDIEVQVQTLQRDIGSSLPSRFFLISTTGFKMPGTAADAMTADQMTQSGANPTGTLVSFEEKNGSLQALMRFASAGTSSFFSSSSVRVPRRAATKAPPEVPVMIQGRRSALRHRSSIVPCDQILDQIFSAVVGFRVQAWILETGEVVLHAGFGQAAQVLNRALGCSILPARLVLFGTMSKTAQLLHNSAHCLAVIVCVLIFFLPLLISPKLVCSLNFFRNLCLVPLQEDYPAKNHGQQWVFDQIQVLLRSISSDSMKSLSQSGKAV
ncbi:hypothetical protein KC325_g207 [Hortaea werneckii]|nr:hypothetical protein KC325_g207 [Hortaea werneckii]